MSTNPEKTKDFEKFCKNLKIPNKINEFHKIK